MQFWHPNRRFVRCQSLQKFYTQPELSFQLVYMLQHHNIIPISQLWLLVWVCWPESFSDPAWPPLWRISGGVTAKNMKNSSRRKHRICLAPWGDCNVPQVKLRNRQTCRSSIMFPHRCHSFELLITSSRCALFCWEKTFYMSSIMIFH